MRSKYSSMCNNRNGFIRLILLLITVLTFSFAADAQKSSGQLKKDKQKIENEIANTQRMLKNTEKNQKASLQQIAMLRQQSETAVIGVHFLPHVWMPLAVDARLLGHLVHLFGHGPFRQFLVNVFHCLRPSLGLRHLNSDTQRVC